MQYICKFTGVETMLRVKYYQDDIQNTQCSDFSVSLFLYSMVLEELGMEYLLHLFTMSSES